MSGRNETATVIRSLFLHFSRRNRLIRQPQRLLHKSYHHSHIRFCKSGSTDVCLCLSDYRNSFEIWYLAFAVGNFSNSRETLKCYILLEESTKWIGPSAEITLDHSKRRKNKWSKSLSARHWSHLSKINGAGGRTGVADQGWTNEAGRGRSRISVGPASLGGKILKYSYLWNLKHFWRGVSMESHLWSLSAHVTCYLEDMQVNF